MFTVGNHQTLLVPVSVVDHEDDGEEGLYQQKGEDGHHCEGRHHSVGLLQVITEEIFRHERQRLLLAPLHIKMMRY